MIISIIVGIQKEHHNTDLAAKDGVKRQGMFPRLKPNDCKPFAAELFIHSLFLHKMEYIAHCKRTKQIH